MRIIKPFLISAAVLGLSGYAAVMAYGAHLQSVGLNLVG